MEKFVSSMWAGFHGRSLDLLAAAYRRLRDEGLPVQLFIVGHGPYSEAFEKSLPEAFFTGYLEGQ